MTTTTQFFDDLATEIQSHISVDHNFLKRFASGDISSEGVRIFAQQYYLYSKNFTRYLGGVLSNIPDELCRRPIIENLWEEYGEGDFESRHPALFRRFVYATGTTPEELEKVVPFPATETFINTYFYLCTHSHFLEGLGALGPATEAIVPQLYESILSGCRKLGLYSEDALYFFTLHIEHDSEHAGSLLEAMLPFASDAIGQKLIRKGAISALNARLLLWQELEQKCMR